MRRLVAKSFLIVALVWAPAALAVDPAVRGYGGGGGAVQREIQPPVGGAPENGAALPFTGLDLGLLVGGGVVLLLVGGSLWRLTREKA